MSVCWSTCIFWQMGNTHRKATDLNQNVSGAARKTQKMVKPYCVVEIGLSGSVWLQVTPELIKKSKQQAHIANQLILAPPRAETLSNTVPGLLEQDERILYRLCL